MNEVIDPASGDMPDREAPPPHEAAAHDAAPASPAPGAPEDSSPSPEVSSADADVQTRTEAAQEPEQAQDAQQEPDAQDAQPQAPAGSRRSKRRSPEQREVRPVLERLFQLHPKLFGARFLPLKLGVFEDLMARHAGEFSKEDLKAALGTHARSTRYLEAVASGAKRHDLDGKPVEPVAPEHVFHAIMEVFRRRKARGKEDPRPWLVQRLVTAIESSGLTREDYIERVRAVDDLALLAIQDAWSEVGARHARREALRRAYESSGKSVEEFAAMYGMKVGEVKALLRAGGPA